MRTYADQIRPYIQRRYVVLGTDGFGRSDMRSQLRKFFEVNRYYIALAALKALADDGEIPVTKVSRGDREVPHRPGQAQSGDGMTGGDRA